MIRRFKLWWQMQRLCKSSPEVRRAAASSLGTLADGRAVPALLAALADEDWGVRQDAAYSLGKLRDHRAIDGLADKLEDPIWPVRRAAKDALLAITWIPSTQRHRAAMAVAEFDFERATIEGEAAVPALTCMLRDGDKHVRVNAVRAIAKVGGAVAVEALIASIKNIDGAAQRELAEALGALQDIRAVLPLCSMLRGMDAKTEAAHALAELGDVRAIDSLVDAVLWERDLDVREVFAKALRSLDSQLATRRLTSVLESAHDADKSYVAEAIGHVGHASGLEPLLDALRNGTDDWKSAALQSAAAEALGNLGDKRAVDALCHAVENATNVATRLKGAAALGKLRDARALQPLMRLLDDDDPNTVREAALALGELGLVEAVEPLGAAAARGDKYIRSSVAHALMKLGEGGVVRSLQLASCYAVEHKKREAVQALAECVDAGSAFTFIYALDDYYASDAARDALVCLLKQKPDEISREDLDRIAKLPPIMEIYAPGIEHSEFVSMYKHRTDCSEIIQLAQSELARRE